MRTRSTIEERRRRDELATGTLEEPSAIAVRSPIASETAQVPDRRMFLGKGTPRGYGGRPRLSPDAAAAFAAFVDPARARAAVEGRTLVYTVRWG